MSTYSPQFRDIKIIPDKFNTGPVNLGQLVKITEPQVCGSISLTARGTNDLALNILYDNTNRTAGEHVCENYDLTNFGSIILLNPSDGVTQRTFTFKNCKLRHFTVGGNDFFEPYLHFNFINCSFTDAMVGARCAYFENCQFNNNDGDCLNGFHDFTLKNCYAYTYAAAQSDDIHVDGIQIYNGNANNILIDNCRFESLEYHGEHSTYINASLMLSIESSDPSNNIIFTDTHVNGGGYSVYTCNKAGGDITNLRLHNIECGECSAFGTQYPSYMATTYFLENDIKNFRELFVSSVMKDEVNNKYQIVVSNDTLSPRVLKVETNKGTTTFNIPASYQRTNVPDTVTSIEDYPVDLVKEVDSNGVQWIACFDITDENNPIQIRYVSFSTNYKPNKYDIKVMPDTHNCGCHGTLTEYDGSDMIYVSDSFPEVTENTFFNHGYLYLNKSNYTHDFVFKNCKFDATKADDAGNYTYCVQTTGSVNANVTFINCTFTGAKSAANSGEITADNRFGCMTFRNCYVYNMQGDGLKGSNTKIYDTYVGVCGLLQGAHADGVQYSKSANCLIDGYRCDNIEFGSDKVANSSVLLGLDSGDIMTSANVTLKDAYVNGGGNTIIIGPDGGYSMPSVVLDNVVYGCSYRYHPSSIQSTVAYDANEFNEASHAFIGSVWKEDNSIHFIVCNYTNSSRTITIKTNNGTYTKTIDKCPTYAEYMADRETYAWDDDFPFNVELTVPDANWFVAWDGEAEVEANQIRYVEFEPSPIEGYIDHIELNGTTYSIYDKEALHGNIVTTIDSSSTDNDIPTAKAVYDSIPVLTGKELISNKVTTISSESTDSEYPSAKCLYLLLGDLEDRLEDI